MKTKFIFVTGGVVSSLGKGINASSIGRLLKNRGLKVFMQKFDPYINYDPGNMSPLQHGEVFVTDDGAETDLDLGHYERIIDENLNIYSSVTSGKVYMDVLENERMGKYDGRTVQVIPHITNEIKDRLNKVAASSGADVVITEIGGTVGDIEGLPFLEAIRQYRRDIGYLNTYYIHNTLVPYLAASGEIKTKPTQHSVKELRSIGINPDMIVLRTEKVIPDSQKEKIALFCDVDKAAVIEARDVETIYEIPVKLAEQKVDEIICKHFKIRPKALDLTDWEAMLRKMKSINKQVKVALIGPYVELKDAYISVVESMQHAGLDLGFNVVIDPLELKTIKNLSVLDKYSGVVIPDGFEYKNKENIIAALKHIRENNIPFLGIGHGMHFAVIEYARNVLGLNEATSEEFNPKTKIALFEYAKKEDVKSKDLRLGLHDSILKKDSKLNKIYKALIIKERFRHQYEFNKKYMNIFENSNLIFSGFNIHDNSLTAIEHKDHPFYVACQFRPEFLSRPYRAHPLFVNFVKTIIENTK